MDSTDSFDNGSNILCNTERFKSRSFKGRRRDTTKRYFIKCKALPHNGVTWVRTTVLCCGRSLLARALVGRVSS